MAKAAEVTGAADQYMNVERKVAGLKQSTYRTHVFLLFPLKFVHESRTLQPNSHTFLGLVQAQRERCTQYAALQRVVHACHMQDTCTYSGSSNHEQPQAYVYLASFP